jgi:hypothetical protein
LAALFFPAQGFDLDAQGLATAVVAPKMMVGATATMLSREIAANALGCWFSVPNVLDLPMIKSQQDECQMKNTWILAKII